MRLNGKKKRNFSIMYGSPSHWKKSLITSMWNAISIIIIATLEIARFLKSFVCLSNYLKKQMMICNLLLSPSSFLLCYELNNLYNSIFMIPKEINLENVRYIYIKYNQHFSCYIHLTTYFQWLTAPSAISLGTFLCWYIFY